MYTLSAISDRSAAIVTPAGFRWDEKRLSATLVTASDRCLWVYYQRISDRAEQSFCRCRDEEQLKEEDTTNVTAIETTRLLIYDALYNVYDPELGVNIIDLGLVYGVTVNEEGYVTVTMTLTTPGCPMHESISEGVGAALVDIPAITGGEVRLVWEPQWEPSRMTYEGRRLLGFA